MFFNIITITALITIASTQMMEIRNLHQDPILLVKYKNCKIQTGLIKIIHPINVTNLETNVNLFNKLARKLDSSLPISQLVIQKSRELYNNLLQIKPLNRKRKRRWDTLGAAWKWLAGSPDAEDLRIINKTTNELIQENNHQIRINQMISNRIGTITNTVNQLIAQQNLENKILLEEYEAVKILLYMDTLNSIVVEIQDTILRTRVALPNNKLLTLKEILLIETLLHEQGIETQFPEQALNYAKPKIATRNELLLYILEIPELQKSQSETIGIFPLIVNDTIITNIPKYIIKSGNDIFTTLQPENYIQHASFMQPLKDNCTYSMMMGIETHCDAVLEHETSSRLISDNKILINNAKNLQIHSTCGPHNRSFSGNYLITFSNCSIIIKDQVFTSREVTGIVEEIQGAFPNLSINRTIVEHHDIPNLSNFTKENRQQLELMNLKQYKHQQWIFSILGGLSTSAIGIVAVTIYVCTRKRKIILKIRQPKLNKVNPATTEITRTT